MNGTFVYMWEFNVRPEADASFLEAYAAGGLWTELFRKGSGFVETRLFQDEAAPGRYVTMDVWESEKAYREFLAEFADEYDALDQHCESFMDAERALGEFRSI
ncbi:MAG: antibiotic biosynthesis monooxygenase [Vicinamibacterales bacterium]